MQSSPLPRATFPDAFHSRKVIQPRLDPSRLRFKSAYRRRDHKKIRVSLAAD